MESASCLLLFADMDYLVALTAAFCLFYVIQAKVAVSNESVVQQLYWKEAVEEVRKTNSLAQVLKEYLGHIETVEAAASKCSASHREQHQRMETALQREMDFCLGTSETQRETLVACVEGRVERLVSDVRLFIVTLKNCLDTS